MRAASVSAPGLVPDIRVERTALLSLELTAPRVAIPALVFAVRSMPEQRYDATQLVGLDVPGHTESVHGRLETIMAVDDPKFLHVDPDCWAEERQYLRNDATAALDAFRRRRWETGEFLKKLSLADLRRRCIHPVNGRSRSTRSWASWPGTTTITSSNSSRRSKARSEHERPLLPAVGAARLPVRRSVSPRSSPGEPASAPPGCSPCYAIAAPD
jgi:hypothetical protein